MTEKEAKHYILEAFESANITLFKLDLEIQEAILDEKNLELSSFDMGSLALMEVCISIEINAGVSITPAELSQMTTVDHLVMRILKDSS